MDKKKIEHFRVLLEGLREQTAGDYERTVESSGEEFTGTVAPDPNDEASRTMNRRLLLQISDLNHELLARINEATDRIEEGDFGKCVECGEEIPEGRLELVPYTEHCVGCQEKAERGEKENG